MKRVFALRHYKTHYSISVQLKL